MNILVTGGCGFIGSNLVRRLSDRNSCRITVLDNLSSGRLSNIGKFSDVNFVRGDILDKALLSDLVSGTDVIFHLAAQVGNIRSIQDPHGDVRNNITGTLNILEECKKKKQIQIIFSSSAACYGESRYLPIDEMHPIDPDSPYGADKFSAEKLVLAIARIYKFEAVCLRYFNVYGENQYSDEYGNVIPIFIDRILQGQEISIFGDGEQTRDFVNVDDVVSANILAMENQIKNDYFNIGSGSPVTINNLVKIISHITGIRIKKKYLPLRPGEVIHSYSDISKAGELLKFKPETDLESGLKKYIKWKRGEYRDE